MVLDWYIAMALAAPYVFLTDVFSRVAAAWAYLYRRRQGDVSVEELIENAVGPAGSRRRELLDVSVSVYRAHNALSSALDRRATADEELSALRHALVDFGRAARDSPDVAARYSLDRITRATASPHKISPYEARFEADLVRACLSTGMTYTEAVRVIRLVRGCARQECAAARAREASLEVQEGLHASRPRDVLAVSVVCVCWAAFQVVRPWVYWEGLGRGRRGECDVQLMWFFVPTSAYGEKFGIFLKVWGVVMAVLGLVAFSYGVVSLGKSVLLAGKGVKAGVLSDVESQRSLLGVSESSGSSISFSESGMRYRKARPSRPCRVYFRCLGILQLLALGVVAAMVEGTLWVNRIDMGMDDPRMSTQIFALVVGAVASIPVYWECLVIVPLRWAARRASKGE